MLPGRLNIWANVAYNRAIDPDGFEFADVPTWKASIAPSYHLRAPIDLQFLLVGRYVDGYRTSGPREPSLDPYFEIDARIASALSSRYTLELHGKNIVGSEYALPLGGTSRVRIDTRSISMSLKAEF